METQDLKNSIIIWKKKKEAFVSIFAWTLFSSGMLVKA